MVGNRCKLLDVALPFVPLAVDFKGLAWPPLSFQCTCLDSIPKEEKKIIGKDEELPAQQTLTWNVKVNLYVD